MTDKELLELAVKAWMRNCLISGMSVDESAKEMLHGKGFFNPLTDDGDALRLAVKLNMLIDPNNGHVTTCTATGGFAEAEECTSECKYAATRRAIVRAAAAIWANECAT